jgi:DNA-binding NarL/FixJ family response regulator
VYDVFARKGDRGLPLRQAGGVPLYGDESAPAACEACSLSNQVMATAPIRILCVDDHPLVREGLAALINRQDDMQIVAEAASGREGIEAFRTHRPDVTLIDLRLPDISGIELITTIVSQFPGARTLVISSYEGDIDIRRALSAGAMGYVLKGMPRDTLLGAIRRVHRGQRAIPPDVAEALAEHLGDESLTPRELEILTRVAAGGKNREVAIALKIAEDTVKVHMKRILAKLGVADRTEAVTAAVKRGMIRL